MQNFPQGVLDREGSFVFQVLKEYYSVEARKAPNVGDEHRTGLCFQGGALVSIDLVRHSRVEGSHNGPFLRLSDGSGWLFASKYGEPCLREVTVETGLWCFYVDNVPYGQSLRRHPIDRDDLKDESARYQPMQKLYCDRKVKHPDTDVCYYRVQGAEGWVFDKRPVEGDGEDRVMLLDDSMVETGLFAYEAIDPIAIRRSPNVGDESRTERSVAKGEIVAVNAIRQSLFRFGNGPFLRLTDGTGWLFEDKQGKKWMQRVAIEEGSWTLKTVNSAGIGLRSQPIDSERTLTGLLYEAGKVVMCDRKIRSSSGVNYYRVSGTVGWVFDKREGHAMMELQSCSPSRKVEFTASSSWSPDFVRGISIGVEGLKEIAFKQSSRMISFRNRDGARVNVYYTTRTVGTAIDHPTQGKTQLFRRNCSPEDLLDVFKNPRVHTGRGYKRRRLSPDVVVSTTYGSGILVEDEEELRNNLLECDQEFKQLAKKRQQLLKFIRDIDLQRAQQAVEMKQRTDERREELEKKQKEKRDLQERTCNECDRVFQNKHAKEQHYRDAHVRILECDYCGRFFKDFHALDQHRDSLDHW